MSQHEHRVQQRRVRGASRARRGGIAVVALGAALVMAGCAAGQAAETAGEPPAVNGAVGTVGSIAIRDASMVYPTEAKGVYAKGSDVELALTIVSQGVVDDKLVKVASPIASGVRVQGSRVIPGEGALVVGAPAHVGNGGLQPKATRGSAATTSAVESAGDEGAIDQTRIVLTGTTRPIRSGHAAEVTFTFAEAGSITLNLPVATPTHENSSREGGPSDSGPEVEQTGHAGEGAHPGSN